MAKKKYRSSVNYISPIHPSLHFLIFLVLAFILVVVVAVFMRATAVQTRARLLCPQTALDEREVVQDLSRRCGSSGIQYAKDANGCGMWICK